MQAVCFSTIWPTGNLKLLDLNLGLIKAYDVSSTRFTFYMTY